MKKLLAILTIFALVLIGCGNEDSTNNENGDNDSNSNNSDVIGTWGDTLGEVTLEISDGTWVFVLGPYNFNGTWTRAGSILTLTRTDNSPFGTATLSGNELRLNASFPDNDGFTIYNVWDLSKGSSFQKDGKLTIRNESSFMFYYPKWNGGTFTNISPSFSETLNVTEGSGYLFFTLMRRAGMIECRTQDAITVSKGETKVFVVTNNTLVIALDDTTNTQKRLQEIVTKPVLELRYNTTIIYNDYNNDNPVPIDFGTVAVTTSKSLSFTIKNTGNFPLELKGNPVISCSNSGVFTIPTQPNTPINPDASVTFIILYTPISVGEDTGTITIMNNSDDDLFLFKIKGTGYIE